MRGLRHYGPFILLFLVGLIGFSTFAVNAASADAEGEATIPSAAIRIRIIANSDSDRDQAIKRVVRDQEAALIEAWGTMPDTIEEARALIRSHLKDVQKTADRALKSEKAGYGAKVELAKVDFPAKTFEGKSYPAGKYEALRVTLGDGQGANWWCVLFPPLCLTAAVAPDEAPASSKVQSEAGATASSAGKKTQTVTKTKASSVKDSKASSEKPGAQSEGKPHAKFFIWVLIQKLFAFLRALFS